MNYLRHYCNLIRKAENRTPPEGYIEKHHTFPVSIFGKNNRIVVLTAREHYIAHALLEKAFIKRYGLKDKRTIKMTYAFWCMNTTDKCRTGYKNSHRYNLLRSRYIENKKGVPISLEQRKRLSEFRKGTKRNLSEEERQRLRENCNIGYYVRTESHIKKLKENNIVYVYEVISPEGEKFIIDSMNEFCNQKIQYKLDRSAMNRVARGEQKSHKGWKVSIIRKLKDD